MSENYQICKNCVMDTSEEKLLELHKLPECTEKFKSQAWFYNLEIRVYELLGIEKRIRR